MIGSPAAVATGSAAAWRLELPRNRHLELARRPLVMGIVNLTPDSFSDGGRWSSPAAAVAGALEMVAQGAALVDLGAESTRPGGGVYGRGADEVPWQEECARLLPALEQLRDATDAVISVDTRKASVARAALEAGADLVNDVSALSDPDMAEVVAGHEAPVVLMHSRGEIATMQRGIRFLDVVEEVVGELEASLERAVRRGVPEDRILLDPGLGFGKTEAQNLRLLRNLDRLHRLGRPVVVGASRKSFIGRLTREPAQDRLAGSLAAAGWAEQGHVQILRVHDVAATARFLRVWRAIDDEGAAS